MEHGTSALSTRQAAAPSPVVRAQTDSAITRQRLLLGVLVVAVVVADQGSKWWAWRHSGTATINSGGDELVGDVVGSWFRSRIGGGALDIVDAAALASLVAWILRRRRPVSVFLSAGMVLAGLISNLSDRLVLHYWTAPGSIRGAVDFLRIGRGAVYNGADIVVVLGAIGLVGSVCWYRHGRGERERLDAAMATDTFGPGSIGSGWRLLFLVGVAVLAVYGVTHPGFIYTPVRLWSGP